MGYAITRAEIIEAIHEAGGFGDDEAERIADAVLAKIREKDRCYGKVAEGDGSEPIFVLRSHDPVGAAAVFGWMALARAGDYNAEKLASAQEHAQRMIDWFNAHGHEDIGSSVGVGHHARPPGA